MLQSAAQWLDGMRRAHLVRTIGYQRTSTGVVTNVAATVGQTIFRLNDTSGATVRLVSRDYLVSAGDLQFPPAEGDVITDAGRRYEVLDIAGEGCWRFSDPYGQTYRIHTKDIGAAP
jgi:hypothetical protein